MRGMTELKRDERGGAGAKLTLLVAMAALPLLYPAKTMSVVKNAHAGWQNVWTIDGLRGRGA
jgi:hypothetical protein